MLEIVIVFVIDKSGLTDTMVALANKILRKYGRKVTASDLKPFTCSLCTMWWVGLLYLLVAHQFSILGLLVVAVLSYLTYPISELMGLVRDSVLSLICWLQSLLMKL